jgi:hypothetical protein
MSSPLYPCNGYPFCREKEGEGTPGGGERDLGFPGALWLAPLLSFLQAGGRRRGFGERKRFRGEVYFFELG